MSEDAGSKQDVKSDVTDATLNPKHATGSAKSPMHFTPPAPLFALGRVFAHGAAKYGAFNWGDAGVVASIYYDAMQRHLAAWYAGETIDPESGEPHLAHVMACCAIVMDCAALGNLVDDRPIGKTSRPVTSMRKPLHEMTVAEMGRVVGRICDCDNQFGRRCNCR